MADPTVSVLVDDLRHELDEKARELSELDVMLADYQAERDRLIVRVRVLQGQLRDRIEQSVSDTPQSNSQP